MNSIQIISWRGRVSAVIDGALIRDLSSLSVEYMKGAPVRVACVAELPGAAGRAPRVLHRHL